ncbi:MAG: triose-phosphate isomerase [Gammaproteobacteria bacterium]|jgi:triosephosphate isomerase (TIM)|nr:triose-phosphate isomerase [Gammaproteobacteria bacterium]MBT5862827.1 triose-phosphate isomerase [Gammaproteobacteria bacterium]
MNNQKYLIAANWKQNGDAKSLIRLINNFIRLYKKAKPTCDILILPPAIYLETILNRLKHHKVSRKKISLGAQNISPYQNGAYTGELSVDMTKDYNCNYTLVGHSERRHVFNEDEKIISKKVRLSIESGMQTILCVGETIAEYNSKSTKKVILRQLKSALVKSANLIKSDHNKIIIAYEPVWAIGTGKTASLDDIRDVHGYIHNSLSKILGTKTNSIKILYGGSVNNLNAASILVLSNVNGALVGGASLNSKKFIDICSSI